jgi:hypothetical protein
MDWGLMRAVWGAWGALWPSPPLGPIPAPDSEGGIEPAGEADIDVGG